MHAFGLAMSLVFSCWLTTGEPAGDGSVAPDAKSTNGPAATRAQRRQAAAALAARLGSPAFEAREEATRKLEELGIDAIDPLFAAASGENLEVTCRAIRALAVIFESGDDNTFDAAEAALEKLAESSNRSAAQRAAEVLSPQDVAWEPGFTSRGSRRWKRAAARIRALGGIVHTKERHEGQIQAPAADTESLPEYVMIDAEWKGGSAGLVNLRRLAGSLPRSLYARGTPPLYVIDGAPVSTEALAQIRQLIPSLEIQYRGAARLGVQCSASDPTCRITGIEPDSAADRAGLKVGDYVRRYDAQTLIDFDHLASITRGHKVGDKVELEILREGETIKLQAELTGWSPKRSAEAKK
jgi:hypothetical protein